MEKVYITEANKATFICPKCERTRTVDVSRYAKLDQTVRVQSKCPCGHSWTAVLEKRRQYRKRVDLPGAFILLRDRHEIDRGSMTVVDLSAGGVKLKLNVPRMVNPGDRLRIEFHLNDAKKTFMQKNLVVRNVSGAYIGAAFSANDPYDPVLGFYLMS